MLAIVISHVLYNNKHMGMAPFDWHVPGFLVITGFFGTSFKWKKVLNLLVVCYACYWLTIPIHGLRSIGDLFLPHGGWFVPFYVCLLMISPILNAALKDRTVHRQIFFATVAILAFVWIPVFVSRLAMMKVVQDDRGLLLMIAPYLLGRLCAEYRWQEKLNVWVLVLVACALEIGSIFLAVSFAGSISYVSPITLALAFVGFALFYQLNLPRWFASLTCFVAPSMFGVYIIHECCIKSWQCSDFAAQSCGNSVIWAIGLFVVCVLIDLIRRFVFRCVKLICGNVLRCG